MRNKIILLLILSISRIFVVFFFKATSIVHSNIQKYRHAQQPVRVKQTVQRAKCGNANEEVLQGLK